MEKMHFDRAAFFSRLKVWLKPKYWLLYGCIFGAVFFHYSSRAITRKAIVLNEYNRRTDTAVVSLQNELLTLRSELEKLKTVQSKPETKKFIPQNLIKPIAGKLVRGFEWIKRDNVWRLNSGVELAANVGSKVLAAADGIVTEVREAVDGSYTVTIEHGEGWETRYGNLGDATVVIGDEIVSGMVLGKCGNGESLTTESGLFFEMYHNKTAVDPTKYIKGF